MYRKHSYRLTTLLLWAITTSVIAYSGKQDNWNVDGLNGGLYVSATLLTSPCSLASESALQEINLGKISSTQLNHTGEQTMQTPVHLILENCLFGSELRDAGHGNNLAWYPANPALLMSFTGSEDQYEPSLFGLHGDVSGAALRIKDAQLRDIYPGQKSYPQVLQPGRNDLILYAQLERTAGPLIPGDFSSVLNFELEYQ